MVAVLQATLLQGRSALLVGVVWGLWGVLMLRLLWNIINWAVDYFVITSDRILLTSGVFTRSVAMMPMSKVTDMSFHRTVAGRMLGYGDFVVESAGKDQVLRTIDHVPYPEQLYRVVCGRIFKDPADEEEFEPQPEEEFEEAEQIEVSDESGLPDSPEDGFNGSTGDFGFKGPDDPSDDF